MHAPVSSPFVPEITELQLSVFLFVLFKVDVSSRMKMPQSDYLTFSRELLSLYPSHCMEKACIVKKEINGARRAGLNPALRASLKLTTPRTLKIPIHSHSKKNKKFSRVGERKLKRKSELPPKAFGYVSSLQLLNL